MRKDPEPATRGAGPEILAPAGDPLALRAALAAGADAVYLGMARFNARGRAERFRGVALERCVRAAHDRGARVYVTLNTLLHDDELDPALALAQEALEAGADAAIVQDLGLAALLCERLPALPLHGSTQMTLHQPRQALEAAQRLGLRRVIAARECSLEEVGAMARALAPLGAGLEVFVHGALCFAYSGQCLMSNFAGRRSANRGICAQNCRFDFTAGPPTAQEPILPRFSRKDASQLISMKDLAAFDAVGRLADLGVASFKIEGRLKGPEYVAEVVALYRAAVDAWRAGRPFAAQEAERMAGRVFSRGFTNGYLRGEVTGRMRGDKRRLEGEPDATVVSADRRRGILVLEAREGHRVAPGQGYRYAHDRYRGGFRVLGVQPAGEGRVEARVRFGAEASGRRHRRGAEGRRRAPPPLPLGLGCHLNDDPSVEGRAARLAAAVTLPPAREPPRLLVEVRLEGRPGAPLRATAAARPAGAAGEALPATHASAESAAPLEAARARALTPETLREHLGRLGGTRYALDALDASGLEGDCFLALLALHALRRELVARLDAAAPALPADPAHRVPAQPAGAWLRAAAPPAPAPARRRAAHLTVAVSDPSMALIALERGARDIIIDDPAALRGDPDSLERWREVSAGAGRAWLRLSPIAHDPAADERALGALAAQGGGAGIGALAGHLGQVALARELRLPIAADYFLNAANSRTLAELERAGALRATLSLELDAKDAGTAAHGAPAGLEVEVVIGGRVFSMLTRQGYEIEPGRTFLAVSEHGHAYAFEARAGITWLHEAREMVGARLVPALAASVDSLRLDLAHAPAAAVGEVVAAYARAIASGREEDAEEAARAHGRHAPHGTFEGHLRRGARALDGAP